MSSSYPTLPFSIQDVRDLYETLQEHYTGVTITVQLHPTPKDQGRVYVGCSAFRRAVRVGQTSRVECKKYLPSGKPACLDKTVADLLWELFQDLDPTSHYGGTYTELIPGLRPPRS